LSVSVAIQTHPLRADLAETLLGCLGDAELVYDPEPGSTRSPWRTYRHALETTPAGASHRLVLQDDVLVCDYFVEGVRAAARARPGRVLVFFVAGNPANHRRAVFDACEQDWAWAELDLNTWIPAVATCWPVHLIEPMLEWFDAQNYPPAFTADDEIIGRFLRHQGERPLASVPSLVEHPDTVPSLAGRRVADGRDPGRRAACWIGDCGCDARRIDWTTGPG
jgi:hypothetical protein